MTCECSPRHLNPTVPQALLITKRMQLTPNLINNNSNYICTRSPSGLVLEVTSISSGNSGLQVVAASPVNQNLCQYFVITELPGQESFTIENAAATGTFLQPTNPAISAPLTLIASSRRFADRSQEWKLTLEKNDNDRLVVFTLIVYSHLPYPHHRDYYLIESVRYPGNVLALDQRTRTVRLNIRGQSPQPAVDQYWALIPAGAPPDYLLDKDSTELQDLKDNVAGLKEEIADKDSLIKDKDEEITRLKEIIEALSVPTPSAVEPDDATEATIAVVLFDFEVMSRNHRFRHSILKSNARQRKTLK